MTALTASNAAAPADAARPPIDVDDLRELMQSVSEVGSRLQETHAALQSQVTRLKSELAQANAQLRRSRSLAALGEMAAGIAHEIRNPLGSIQLYAQMLEEDLDDRPELGERCRRIHEAVRGLDAIVSDVLTFARDIRVSSVPCDAATLIDRTLSSVEALLTDGDVEIVRGSDECVEFEADANLFTLAHANLVRNAIEAMRVHDCPTKRIRLEAVRESRRLPDGGRDEFVVFAVEDTGPGVPPEIVARMFNPFFTTRESGTGLGLAIVHRIADAHGGRIDVGPARSSASGARFELALPLRPNPPAVAAGDRDGVASGVSLSDSVTRRIAMEGAAR